jgi:hypothetical protein
MLSLNVFTRLRIGRLGIGNLAGKKKGFLCCIATPIQTHIESVTEGSPNGVKCDGVATLTSYLRLLSKFRMCAAKTKLLCVFLGYVGKYISCKSFKVTTY